MNSCTKSQLRSQLRQRRRALDASQQQLAARRVLQQLQRLPEYQRARHLAAYMASDGELSLHWLFQHAKLQGKRCYLPVIRPGVGQMAFHPYRRGQLLRANHFAIAEPGQRRRPRAAADLELVLVPLVGFDRCGQRLGMGGGYYDRALARRRGRRPFVVGVAHHCQEVDALPSDPWDIPMDAIVTDRETIRPRGRRAGLADPPGAQLRNRR